MSNRTLTSAEIRTLSAEYDTLDEWQRVFDFAGKYFVGEAAKVSVETDYQSNDNGGSYQYVTGVQAYGTDGKALSLNDIVLDNDMDDFSDDEKNNPDILEEYRKEAMYELYGELRAEYGDYLITEKPKVSFPEVFVETD